MFRPLAFVALALFAALSPPALAQTLQQDFVAEPLSGTFTQPTCFRFVNSHDILVCEKRGLLFDVRDGAKRPTPVIDLQAEILNNGDRGLLCVAIDPNFAVNGWIYLLYVVDPDGDGVDDEMETFGRLTRFTTSLDASGNLVADPTSRQVLIGATWTEGFPSLHLSHAPGDLHFASDGSLFVSTGDGAHFDLTDPGGFDPGGFGPGKFDSSEDIGAFRSQSFTSLAGKILRIDPATGLGLPDNPFYTGNAADHQSRIWAMGLRNPFRFNLIPGTGPIEQLYICNVGWDTWESDYICKGGENFGWPCLEGALPCTPYTSINLNGDCNDPSIFTKPFWYYRHDAYDSQRNPDFVGTCTSGACVYTGSEYPSLYQNRIFVADYSVDWIRSMLIINGQFTETDPFVSQAGHPVDLQTDPQNGDLLYAAIGDGVIRRVRYTKANNPPVALATIAPTYGPAPLAVSLDASASYDPERGALTYDWDLGDGTHSSLPVLTKTYAGSGVYDVVLTVTDPTGLTGSLTQTISVDNSPPKIDSIDSPPPGSFFVVGQAFSLDATVSDAEDDANSIPLSVQWVVDLVHDHHTHPAWATLDGAHTSYVPPVHGEGVYLHVTLTVTDSGGLSTSQDFVVYDLNARPEPHIVSVSDDAPRIGHSIVATGHVHYAGHGDADLAFDWGDGSVDRFRASDMIDCTPSHLYAAPGAYSLRLTASDAGDSNTVLQRIDVRPLFPQVAIFAPLIVEHWIPVADQWSIASDLVGDLANAGFDAQIFGSGDQARLETWLETRLADPPRDWLLCLDDGASVAYAGENDGSLAERWLHRGNGVVWTGFNPFANYLMADGSEQQQGAGDYALDELLNADKPHLVSGSGQMALQPDGADLPSLAPFASSTALVTKKLDPSWSVAKLYASDGSQPPVSDALVVRNARGGEYAQFFCVDDATLPREDVLREFFLSHVFAHLPAPPKPFHLVRPAIGARLFAREPTLVWSTSVGATSWLVEVAHDSAFRNPVFTTTVPRDSTIVGPNASVKVTPPLAGHRNYYWRVTARNDFGDVVSEIRAFTVK
jgi:glucose/arabinose dehydrogenase